MDKASNLPPGKAEIEHYSFLSITLSEKEDPVKFWMDNESTYSLLSNIAIDLLCIPASSASVERIFSTAGESTSAKRTDCLTRIWKEKSLSEETSNIYKCTIISFVEVYVFN